MPSAIGKPLRIASASGSVTDRRHGFATLAEGDDVSFIIGDWMSEYSMTTRGGAKVNGAESTAEYEQYFLESIVPALPDLKKRGIRVAVNAGGSDTKKLHHDVLNIDQGLGLNLNIAWIEGDEVSDIVARSSASGNAFRSLTTGLSEWGFDPIYAQAYFGSFGIVEALNEGADIVHGGRVADACPTIAVWRHFIEWSTYANYWWQFLWFQKSTQEVTRPFIPNSRKDTVKKLLDEDYSVKPIFRFELLNIQAVYFLLKDHLDRGVASSSTHDVLGKNLAEYRRCKHVEIPNKFLDRGRI